MKHTPHTAPLTTPLAPLLRAALPIAAAPRRKRPRRGNRRIVAAILDRPAPIARQLPAAPAPLAPYNPHAGLLVPLHRGLAHPYQGTTHRSELRAAHGRASRRAHLLIRINLIPRDGAWFALATPLATLPRRIDLGAVARFGTTPTTALHACVGALRALGHPFTLQSITTQQQEDHMKAATAAVPIGTLPIGTSFVFSLGDTEKHGILVHANESRARVKLASKARSFTTSDGQPVTIGGSQFTDWAVSTLVIPTTSGPRRSKRAERNSASTEVQMTSPAIDTNSAAPAKRKGRKPAATAAQVEPVAPLAPVTPTAVERAKAAKVAKQADASLAALEAKLTAPKRAKAAPAAPAPAPAPAPAAPAALGVENEGQRIVRMVDECLAANPGVSRRAAFNAVAEALGKSLLNVQSRYYTLTKGARDGDTPAAPAAPRAPRIAAPAASAATAAPSDVVAMLAQVTKQLAAIAKALEAQAK